MTGERTVGRRSVPGTDRTASVLGVSVELPPIAPPEADRQLVALLRKARGEGVTVFDVGGSNSPARAEHLVATAFPQHDPELLIIVRGALPTSHMPRPSATTMPVPADPRVLDGLRTRLTKSRARLAPQTPGILEWGVDEANPEELSLILPALESLRSAGEVTGWSLRLRPDREALGAHLAHDRPKLISTELSLLDPLLTAYLEAQAGTAEFGAFVRGPFAGGLLDGTRFTSALSDRSPRSAPIDV
ncbi:MAG: hypothetical protein ABSB97_06155, partial [Thermoplasmata archaeon]